MQFFHFESVIRFVTWPISLKFPPWNCGWPTNYRSGFRIRLSDWLVGNWYLIGILALFSELASQLGVLVNLVNETLLLPDSTDLKTIVCWLPVIAIVVSNVCCRKISQSVLDTPCLRWSVFAGKDTYPLVMKCTPRPTAISVWIHLKNFVLNRKKFFVFFVT